MAASPSPAAACSWPARVWAYGAAGSSATALRKAASARPGSPARDSALPAATQAPGERRSVARADAASAAAYARRRRCHRTVEWAATPSRPAGSAAAAAAKDAAAPL